MYWKVDAGKFEKIAPKVCEGVTLPMGQDFISLIVCITYL